MSPLLAALLGAVVGIVLREVWVFRQVCADDARKSRPASLRRVLLSPLGRHTYDLLQRRGEWQRIGVSLVHYSGRALKISAYGGFDIADPPGENDYRAELPWLDRQLLWTLVRDLDQQLKYPEILGRP